MEAEEQAWYNAHRTTKGDALGMKCARSVGGLEVVCSEVDEHEMQHSRHGAEARDGRGFLFLFYHSAAHGLAYDTHSRSSAAVR